MSIWDQIRDGKIPWQKRKGFFPKNSLEGKNNFLPTIHIFHPNLTPILGVYLTVPDMRLREQIIFSHYFQQYAKLFADLPLGIWVNKRDNPWDFEIETSQGNKLNIEIISIAESHKAFKNRKDTEMFIGQTNAEQIPFSLLQKVNAKFPDESVDKLIARFEAQKASKNQLVDNPIFNTSPNFFARN